LVGLMKTPPEGVCIIIDEPPNAHVRCNLGCPLWAKSGLMHRSK
jgi:hypothetical protein